MKLPVARWYLEKLPGCRIRKEQLSISVEQERRISAMFEAGRNTRFTEVGANLVRSGAWRCWWAAGHLLSTLLSTSPAIA
jgi:hypothetical protein